MDARVGALSLAVWPCLLAAVMAHPAPCVAQAAMDSAADLERTFRLHDAWVEAWFDPATWAALDALLLDPVALRRGAVTRLAALPWLDSSHLQALQRAPTLRSWQDVARLPGWNQELARSLVPFVRWETRPASWSLQGRTRWTRARRETRWFAAGSGWTAALRLGHDGGQSGYVGVQRRRFSAWAGDLRLGVSQGLLWWSSQSDLRASSAPLRRARPLLGTDVDNAARALRGWGVELRWGRGSLQVARGRAGPWPLTGVVSALQLPRGMVLRGCWLRLQRRSAFAAACGWSGPAGGMEIEILPMRRGGAAVWAAERRWRRLRVATRLQVQAPTAAPSMAAAGVTARRRGCRDALLRASWRRRRLHVELAVHRARRADSLGTRSDILEQRGALRWAGKSQSLQVRLRWKHDRHRRVDLEATQPAQEDGRRSLVLRTLRALDARSSIGLDYRSEEAVDAAHRHRGSAWQAHLHHRRGVVRVHLAVTSFSAPSGLAAPVVADPGIGTAPASRLLVGDGIRLALALRAQTQRLAAAARVARSFVLDRPPTLEWELTLRARVR